jgi:hypothetical protein
MTMIDRDKAFKVPQAVFGYPQAVLRCRELSHDEKLTVLRNWKQELVQLQKAGEENMRDERGPSEVGSRLAEVNDAMIALEERSPA